MIAFSGAHTHTERLIANEKQRLGGVVGKAICVNSYFGFNLLTFERCLSNHEYRAMPHDIELKVKS